MTDIALAIVVTALLAYNAHRWSRGASEDDFVSVFTIIAIIKLLI